MGDWWVGTGGLGKAGGGVGGFVSGCGSQSGRWQGGWDLAQHTGFVCLTESTGFRPLPEGSVQPEAVGGAQAGLQETHQWCRGFTEWASVSPVCPVIGWDQIQPPPPESLLVLREL